MCAPLESERAGGTRVARGRARATVFGLDVLGEELPPQLLAATRAQASGRTLELAVEQGGAESHGWPGAGELVCDQREHDARVSFRIWEDRRSGFLISGPEYGSYLIAGDGSRVVCLPEGRAPAAWQRLLVAQVLPFAAALRGLEVLHASAVLLEQGLVVFAGPSRAGKTSLALELCRRGAGFFADDVLALECQGERLVGHPGIPLARLAQASASDPEKQLVSLPGVRHPAPLAALYLLERRDSEPHALRFEQGADPRQLLGATFNSVLSTPARLRRVLEVGALLAALPVERVAIGADVAATQAAGAIARRLGVR
jgi:hypothetical protein